MAPVTSFTLVWIKILHSRRTQQSDYVTSFTLVWIKIIISRTLSLL